MTKAYVFLLILLISNLSLLVADESNTFSQVTIDTVSFEENGFLNVSDQNGKALVMYNRFDNTNLQHLNIKNTMIYDLSGKLIMTIVVNFDGSNLQLHFQNNHKQRGLIEFISTIDIGKININVSVDYFSQNYSMIETIDIGFKGSEIVKKVYWKDKLIFHTKDAISRKGETESFIKVDNDYLISNETEAGIWAIILHMCKELGK